jgi:Flp pilus assembly protein CpaB
MILILIALGCGLIASIGISQVVERRGGGEAPTVQTMPIYVAMSDVRIGDELGPQTIKLEEWPVDKVPEGAITDAAQLEGMCPRQPLFAGEPIIAAKLADRDSIQNTAKRIPSGYRVMSVKVDMASSVSYLVNPGDRVDVLAYTRSSRGPGSHAQVILGNVEVFAINDIIDREIDGEGNTIQAKTVSLLVLPEQAKKLLLFAQQGKLSLSLRNPNEEGTTEEADEMLAGAPPEVNPLPLMNNFVQDKKEAEFRMEVLEGGAGNVRTYTWDDRQGLPKEISGQIAGSDEALLFPPVTPPFPGAAGAAPGPAQGNNPAGETPDAGANSGQDSLPAPADSPGELSRMDDDNQ